MDVAIETIDTLGLAKRLQNAEFSAKQAEAIAEAVRELERNQLFNLATKTDLKDVVATMTVRFVGLLLAQGALIISIIKFL